MIIPKFIYGTAWKEERTTKLVELALESGFFAIDTANQARHYSEARVGDALVYMAKKGIQRSDVWLQTKFTPLNGQDDRIPYDPMASLALQVEQSLTSSLEHLQTDYLDSYLLHAPYNHPLSGREDFEVWAAIESFYHFGNVKAIGLSNVNLMQLKVLVDQADCKPMMVQNRCYANKAWDKEVRDFCLDEKIHYQGFSLLTANPYVLQDQRVIIMVEKYKVTSI